MDDREFAAALRDRDAILILSHLRPDGDTLGSGAALCSALRRMGKTAYLFPNPETTARYLPYVAQFFAPANFVPACVVAVDIATPNLFPQGFSGAVDLCIDHHPSNALYAGDTLLHAEKSACGEAVLDVIELLTGRVTEQEANLLYIAVTTDTGCFQYANTNADTLRAAARLLELGADNRKISMDFFRKISRARMALVGQIYSGMRFFRGGQVAIAVVTRALIDSVHATEDDCDDIAGLPGRAEGVVVSVTIRELLDELYERYKDDAYRLACLITGSRTDGEDLAQEAFVTCAQSIKSLRDGSKFRPWLLKTLSRAAWKYCRKAKRETPVSEFFDAGESESALSAVLRTDEQRRLYAALDTLDEKRRVTVVLYYFDDRSVREIAQATGVTEGTVKSRLFSARRHLRQALTEERKPKEAANHG